METPVDPSHYASLLVERADQREAERRLRRERLLEEAAALGERLRHTYGQHLRVFLIGSVTDLDFFRRDSDIDIAAMGLSPEQYWEAWGLVERLLPGTSVDFIRVETAVDSLREHILTAGIEL